MIISVAVAFCLCARSQLSSAQHWYMEMCRFSISYVLQHIYMYVLWMWICVYANVHRNLRMGFGADRDTRAPNKNQNRPSNSYLRFCNWCAEMSLSLALARVSYFNSFYYSYVLGSNAVWFFENEFGFGDNTIFPIRIDGVCGVPRFSLFRIEFVCSSLPKFYANSRSVAGGDYTMLKNHWSCVVAARAFVLSHSQATLKLLEFFSLLGASHVICS